jgi:mono/diheme cytochrome c family protein
MKRLVMGIGVLALGLVAQAASAQDTKIEKGMKVYADQKCAMCHSVAGKGNAKGSLDGVGTKLTVEEIRQWIVDPVAMIAKTKAERKPLMTNKYAALPKEDLDALVAYVVSLKKK